MSAPNPRASDRALEGSGIGPERVRAPPCVAMRPPILEPEKLQTRPVRQILNYPRTCESPHRRSWPCRSGYPLGVLAGWLIVFFPVLACVLLFLLRVLVWFVRLRLIRLCRVVFAFALACWLRLWPLLWWLSVVSSVRCLRLLCAVRLSCCSCDVLALSSFVCYLCGRGPIGLRL